MWGENMKDRINDSQSLFEFLSKSTFDNSDDEIAKYLFEHRYELRNKTLKEIAKDSFYSQASFTRFFQKHGVDKFQDFKISLAEGELELKQYSHNVKRVHENHTLDEARDTIIEQLTRNLELFKQLDLNELTHTLQIMNQYKNVLLIGSEFNITNLISFQRLMVANGVNCISSYEPAGQKYLLEHATEDTCIIYINIGNFVYNDDEEAMIANNIKNAKGCKMLWLCNDHYKYTNIYDHIFRFGQSVGPFTPNQLAIFVPLLGYAYLLSIEKPL